MIGTIGVGIGIVALVTCVTARHHPFIDLSHALNNQTVIFPGIGRNTTFNVEFEGYTPNGFWFSSKGFCTSEHSSTHIDAPFHFNPNGRTLDQIPLEDLIDIPAVLVDIYDQVHVYKDGALSLVPNYALSRGDLLRWEAKNGRIPPRSVVLLYSGWAARWPDSDHYLGVQRNETNPERPVDFRTDLNYPGFDSSAATFLVTEREVLGVGTDAISVDIGSASSRMPAHIIFSARNVYLLEMVANLHLLPPRGFRLWMLPFKIDRGTGAPVRIIARITEESENQVGS